ncbi:MAG: Uncharacterised protein [Flavobacteriia bacterium]|nr:MAG: Uncharacterised protein [Flavobacteriia bacterium]
MIEFACFRVQGISQQFNAGQGGFSDTSVGSDVHGRWEGVVRRLRLVDIVVGMEDFFFITQCPSLEHVAAVGDHLVDVHVRLGTRAGLPDHQWKFVIEFPLKDLITDTADPFALLGVKHSEFSICACSGFFQKGKCMNDLDRHTRLLTDLEIVPAAFGLGTPITICWDLNGPHGVPLGTVFHDVEI